MCVDPDADKVRRSTTGDSYIGDVPSDALGRARRRGLLRATTDRRPRSAVATHRHLRADAADGQPRAGPRPHRRAPPTAHRAAPAAPASSSCSSRRPTRARRARCCSRSSRAVRPRGRRRLPPGLLARAHRPGPHRLHAAQHAEGRRRAHRGVHRARAWSSTGASATRVVRGLDARGGRADQAAREHLPLGQHRARQRAGDALRPHGHRHLGGHRRRGDQAVRLHAFKPGPGLGGHCMPVDPFYLSWKAREFDFYTEFIELAGKVNENMPYFCLQQIARALNAHPRPCAAAAMLLLGVAYKSDIDDTARVAGAEDDRAAAGRGRRHRLPRPARPRAAEHGLSSVELDDEELDEADCVAIVTAHSGIDYARVRRAAPLVVDFRNATRPRGTPEREGAEAVSGRRPSAWSGWATGARTWRATSRAWPARAGLVLRPVRGDRARAPAALPGRALHRRLRRAAGRSRARRGRRGHAGAHAPRARAAGARGGQARVRREAARR